MKRAGSQREYALIIEIEDEGAVFLVRAVTGRMEGSKGSHCKVLSYLTTCSLCIQI